MKNLRVKFNDFVKEKGNNLYNGLGDKLSSEVNLNKIKKTILRSAPIIGLCFYGCQFSEREIKPMNYRLLNEYDINKKTTRRIISDDSSEAYFARLDSFLRSMDIPDSMIDAFDNFNDSEYIKKWGNTPQYRRAP
ncbi:hypothetical protein JW949_03025 [Candidatus Woesearchaeota archaeon]|nr:hypothetical protein [Candidatus Woesearchaeota archaeon]